MRKYVTCNHRAGPTTHARTLVGLAAGALVAFAVTPARAAETPILSSSNGITVSAARNVLERTIEADIATAFIGPKAVNGPHRIRISLPKDYAANPTLHYPVVYLLHGGAGGNSAQWSEFGGAAEQIQSDKPVIVVMPDGGKVGWYTNWLNAGDTPQRWADFYLDQVIPWVDANFRTVLAKSGRAIAGLSMGGHGAVRLAQDRPDLFASVASFSGAVNLADMGTRGVITEQAVANGFSPSGPFGTAFPMSSEFKAKNPTEPERAKRLRGTQILLYAGAGFSDADAVERTMGTSTSEFAAVLEEEGIEHTWWMYGRPGPATPEHPFDCDGGHNFGCWNLAFHDALPKMMTVLSSPSADAQGAPPAPPASSGATLPPAAGAPPATAEDPVASVPGAESGCSMTRHGKSDGALMLLGVGLGFVVLRRKSGRAAP